MKTICRSDVTEQNACKYKHTYGLFVNNILDVGNQSIFTVRKDPLLYNFCAFGTSKSALELGISQEEEIGCDFRRSQLVCTNMQYNIIMVLAVCDADVVGVGNYHHFGKFLGTLAA